MKIFIAIFAVAIATSNAAPYASFEDNTLDEDVTYIDLTHFGSSIFGVPSNETGKIVASYNPQTSDLNPEELGQYLEGDMLMPPNLARNGLIASSSHWPGGVVPFEISGYFGIHFSFFFQLVHFFAFFVYCLEAMCLTIDQIIQ